MSVILRCNYRHVQFYFKLHSYPLPEKENYQKKKKLIFLISKNLASLTKYEGKKKHV